MDGAQGGGVMALEAVREMTLNGMGKPLPSAVVRQLQYLWQTAATLAASSPESIPVSHGLSLRFLSLAAKNDVVLPAAVKERLCTKCSVILLPTFTCTVRVRARTQRSSANRRPKTSVGKVRNQLVVHCNLCLNSMARPGAARTSRQAPPSAPTPLLPPAPAVAAVAPSITKKAVKVAPASAAHKAPAHKPSFSFKSLQGGGGGSSSGSSSSSSGGGGGGGGLGNLFGDFVPLGSPGPAAGDKRVNLLELEKQRKKQKKKEGGGALGLNSIQKLFAQGHGQGQGQGKGQTR